MTPKAFPLAANVQVTRQAPISLPGQVLIPIGVDLVGMKIWLDDLSGDPFVWPANMPWWDFGQTFRRFWLEGTPATSGLVYVGPCGSRPGVVPPPNPQPVTLPYVQGAGAAVKQGVAPGGGATAILVAGLSQSQAGNADPILTDGQGNLRLGINTASGGGDVAGITAIEADVSGAGGQIIAAAGPSYSKQNTSATVPANGTYGIWSNLGPNYKTISRIEVIFDGSSGSLKLQLQPTNNLFGSPIDLMAGASGAALAAGQYRYVSDGRQAWETLSGLATPAILRAIFFRYANLLLTNTSGAQVTAAIQLSIIP